MNVTFRQLQLFLALADRGSVSAAARALHVTQPTASARLKEMADAVGLPLYEVVNRRVQLTDAGRELAATARRIAGEWDAFGQRVQAMKGLTRGRLSVALVSTAKYFVPRFLGTFCASHPEVEVSLEVLNRDGVLERLRQNRDDLYVMSVPPTDVEVDHRAFMPNPLVVIAPARHRLAGRRHIAPGELAGERFILREKGSGTRMACDAHFRKLRLRPRVRLELGSNEAIKEAVAGGLGIAVISVHALHDPHGVAVLDVRGFPIGSAWQIVRPRGKRLSPLAEVFQEHMVRHARILEAGWIAGRSAGGAGEARAGRGRLFPRKPRTGRRG